MVTQDPDIVHGVIDRMEISAVFQPIIDLRHRQVFAYEALARSLSPHFDGPMSLYQAAVAAGRVGELGRLHRVQATTECPDWPLFLNIFPNEFEHGWLVRPDDPMFRHRKQVYLEITESVPISHFEQCHSVLWEMRKKGAMLVIDDFGAGFSNIKYIADLDPAIVKLDRELIQDLRRGTRQFRLIRAITRMCQEMGARVVAEGVETAEDLAAVTDAGIDYAQGYHIARPASPPPRVTWSDLG